MCLNDMTRPGTQPNPTWLSNNVPTFQFRFGVTKYNSYVRNMSVVSQAKQASELAGQVATGKWEFTCFLLTYYKSDDDWGS